MQENTTTLERKLQKDQTSSVKPKEYSFPITRECGLNVWPIIKLKGLLSKYNGTIRISYSTNLNDERVYINIQKEYDVVKREIGKGSTLYIVFRDAPPKKILEGIENILSHEE